MAAKKHLALSYSDGSFNVLKDDHDIQQARSERESADRGVTKSADLTDIVRVSIEIVDVVEGHRNKPMPSATHANDLAAARRALADFEKRGGKTLDELRRELGLVH